MNKKETAQGVHSMPADMKKILASSPSIQKAWESITPLARNEWICWVISAKLVETRARRLQRMQEELLEGKRRPCCWAGCMHRTDKSLSPSQKFVLKKQAGKK